MNQLNDNRDLSNSVWSTHDHFLGQNSPVANRLFPNGSTASVANLDLDANPEGDPPMSHHKQWPEESVRESLATRSIMTWLRFSI